MNKKAVPILVILLCSMLLSSCESTTSTNTASGEASVMDAFRNSQPQKRADITGTVKSVIGNEFTIETIDMSSSDVFKEMQDPDFRTKMQTMSDTERQTLMTKMQEARASAKKVLVDVTIPVGIPILVRTGSGGGFGGGIMRGGAMPGGQSAGIGSTLSTNTATRNSTASQQTNTGKQGTIADIKVGSTVTIWLMENTEDRKIASWVSTSSGQTTRTEGGGMGGGGFGGGPRPD